LDLKPSVYRIWIGFSNRVVRLDLDWKNLNPFIPGFGLLQCCQMPALASDNPTVFLQIQAFFVDLWTHVVWWFATYNVEFVAVIVESF